MRLLASALCQLPEIRELTERLQGGLGPAALCGLAPVQRAQLMAALTELWGQSGVLICADDGEARRLAADVTAFSGRPVLQLTGREFSFRDGLAVSHQWEQQRMGILRRLRNEEGCLLVATVDGLLQRTLPPEALEHSSARVAIGVPCDLEELCEKLTAAGYRRADQVEGPGQFARRGGIIDLFSPAYEQPVRVEFFDDEPDSMGFFDVETQRRTENLQELLILPAAEVLPGLCSGGEAGLRRGMEAWRKKAEKAGNEELVRTLERDMELLTEAGSLTAADRYLDLIYPEFASAADYLPPDAVVFLSDGARLAQRAKHFAWQLEEDRKALMEAGLLSGQAGEYALAYGDFLSKLADYPTVMLESFSVSEYPLKPRTLLSVSVKQLPTYGGSLETAVSDLRHYQREDYAVLVLCASRRRAEQLQDLLRAQGIAGALDFDPKALPKPGQILLTEGGISAGMELPGLRLAVITEGQLAPVAVKKAAPQKVSNREKLKSYADLSPGDLVVHVQHGIGRFDGIETMLVDGAEKDYIKISYAGADKLFVPATQLDQVSKYIGGGEESQPRISKLGGTDWGRAKTRAKAAVKEMAKELVELYAQRKRRSGHAFAPDSPWQAEFEEAFPYRETDDQLRCIAEVKADMESSVPMDRLLCGDVGYGKTEVALRAVMKCILDGKQAAILVPTTVLAQQHYTTALERFRGFPVEIAVLSRFRTPAQKKETLRKLKEGGVDLLIGTHSLLQKDVEFKDLGLLVVDEEQRFGVTHKERLKELSRQVDALTLSATPIPRTLNMALSGLRDMSTLEEPPSDRQPVQTYVLEHDWSVLAEAIRREVDRGGQVYYLHNRVETIERTALRLTQMLEGVSIAVAHGKMGEEELSRVMQKLIDGEVSVLVCTTIIETGIDVSNVNTLIVEDADKLGLAQLHQIRGRVGRSSRRAYAYMTYRRGKVLQEQAAKRLSAIREFAEFGSGFKIAMRDLELRGAGNLLGPEQSGYLMSVGYDMYLKLLEEAVLEEQGQPPAAVGECTADLAVSANIPERYIPSAEQRMDIYRRIAHIRTEEDADELGDELMDRYGEPPSSVNSLILVALLRADAARAGVMELSQKGGNLLLKLRSFEPQKISRVCALPAYKGKLMFSAGDAPCLSLRLKKGENVLKEGRKLVEEYGREEEQE